MEIILVLLFLLLSVFFIIIGLTKNSPLFGTAGSVSFIVLSAILIVEGLTIVTGSDATHTMNITTTETKITGNITTNSNLEYTTYKNQYTVGFGILLALIGLRLSQKILLESSQGA